MEELDGDSSVIWNARGQPAAWDIVQFVKFSDFKENFNKLAEEVLKEVPTQMVKYCMSKQIVAQKEAFLQIPYE